MSKYVYLSGPITGLPYDEAKKKFDDAERELYVRYGVGVTVVNPTAFVNKGEEWDYAMRKCIEYLMRCSYIHLLPGWEESKGAMLEYKIAKSLDFGLVDDAFNFNEIINIKPSK